MKFCGDVNGTDNDDGEFKRYEGYSEHAYAGQFDQALDNAMTAID